MIEIIDSISVFLYGFLIVIWLLDLKSTNKNRLIITLSAVALLALQGILYFMLGTSEPLYKLYPFITHLPLFLLAVFVFHKNIIPSIFVICTAYVMTTPRKWLGELLAIPFGNSEFSIMIGKLIAAIPLLILIYYFLRPAVNKVCATFQSKLWIMTIVPALFYIICYIATVYSNVLENMPLMVLGLLSTTLSFVYYFLLIFYFNEISKNYEATHQQKLLSIQSQTTAWRIRQLEKYEEALKEHTDQVIQHLYGMKDLLNEKDFDSANHQLDQLITSLKMSEPQRYCQNDMINHVLRYHKRRCDKLHIDLQISADIPTELRMTKSDALLLFSCALRSASTICCNTTEEGHRKLSLACKTKRGKLLIEIKANTTLVEELPEEQLVEQYEDLKSIFLLAANYRGLCSFAIHQHIYVLHVIA